MTKDNEFGTYLEKKIRERGLTQSSLAQAVNSSVAMVNHLVNGRKTANPQWVNLVADVMGVDPVERTELHRKAGDDLLRRKGYQLDLTKE